VKTGGQGRHPAERRQRLKEKKLLKREEREQRRLARRNADYGVHTVEEERGRRGEG
jgi:hypothetical protein